MTDREQPDRTVADLVVQALEDQGVDVVFGLPGEENLDLLDALNRSSIRFVLTRHEQVAGFMAATYGRLTGRVGVALATLGPGATNLLTAAAHAQLGGMPLLMITGQKPLRSNAQGQFQILDIVDMMAPVTKSTRQIPGAAATPALLRDAIRLALQEKPGATHLELAEDVARETTDAAPIPASLVRRPVPERRSIEAAQALLRDARQPVLMIGAGANRLRTSDVLSDLVEAWDLPFVTSQMGKGVVDERHPLHLGNAALSDGDYVHHALREADLILNVGHDVVEKPPFRMEPDGISVVHVDYSPAPVDPVYFPQVEVVGDIADGIALLLDGFERPEAWDHDRILAIRDAAKEQVTEGADDPRFPVLPQRLVADVRQAVTGDGIIALDNGIYKLWFARNYPAHAPNTVLLDNALATMGAGMAAAMTAAMLHPDRATVAICGDGGFLMNSQDMETAVRMGLDLVVVVLRDDAYGMIRWKQEDLGLLDDGLSFTNPDLVLHAQSYGATGHRPATADAFLPTLTDAIAAGGVHLIDLAVDYSENHRLLHEEIPRRAAEAHAALD